MRTSVAFLLGTLLGSILVSGQAQGLRLAGENYLNHVAIHSAGSPGPELFEDYKPHARNNFDF